MIRLTRINDSSLVLNSDLIEHVETTPDTVITLTTGQKILVREDVDEVIRRVIDYKQRIREPRCAAERSF
jgi:flagellar protein FlbD